MKQLVSSVLISLKAEGGTMLPLKLAGVRCDSNKLKSDKLYTRYAY